MDRCLNGEETTLDGSKRVEKCFSCPYNMKESKVSKSVVVLYASQGCS